MRKERLQKIEEYIIKNEFVTMEKIRDEFGIAMPTVRKDIGELANQGRIEKVYGGAKAAAIKSGSMHLFKNREKVRMSEKNEIAKKAADQVNDGDVIYIDSGTTAASMIRYLDGRHVTVITCNLVAVNAISACDGVEVYIMGGKLNKETMSVDNMFSRDFIDGLNIDKAFMAASGYSLEGGVAQDSYTECEIKQYVLGVATESFLIIDSSKIGRKALARYAGADAIKTIITDGSVRSDYLKYFAENNIKII